PPRSCGARVCDPQKLWNFGRAWNSSGHVENPGIAAGRRPALLRHGWSRLVTPRRRSTGVDRAKPGYGKKHFFWQTEPAPSKRSLHPSDRDEQNRWNVGGRVEVSHSEHSVHSVKLLTEPGRRLALPSRGCS